MCLFFVKLIVISFCRYKVHYFLLSTNQRIFFLIFLIYTYTDYPLCNRFNFALLKQSNVLIRLDIQVLFEFYFTLKFIELYLNKCFWLNLFNFISSSFAFAAIDFDLTFSRWKKRFHVLFSLRTKKKVQLKKRKKGLE